ncbi:unnamed protein product [Microthlaspi erraticum]|uniref:FBD domain-containing protein n=1 Tax=Microthlaspi erraticum TaxID=1685480 RepID=A0A6D2JJX1_9BRAS|nr:unnamed protein product [Microthlaspi erraticum]
MSDTRHLSTEADERIENRSCDLPDDMLLRIFYFVPTKVAAATAVLSKRWRHIWTMMPQISFKDEGSESLEQALQLHKAPKLECLLFILCSVHVDVRKFVENAVKRGVEVVEFEYNLIGVPTRLPKILYTCDTLVDLTLSNQILVDVSSQARLPSLLYLMLMNVVYKDEDSLVSLLSSSPVLEYIKVFRRKNDMLKNFTVKVPSLKRLYYWTPLERDHHHDPTGWLVIDSPAITNMELYDVWGNYCLLENMHCLDEAYIGNVPNPDGKLLTCLSSARRLLLHLTEPMVHCCSATNFSRLIELHFLTATSVDWLEPLMFLLQNSPKLKTLFINTKWAGTLTPSWNQPNSIPECLSSHLEIFGWRNFVGTEDEKQLLKYIFANSNCLKTVKISLSATTSRNLEKKQKEIGSMPRISTSSQLLFPNQLDWSFRCF